MLAMWLERRISIRTAVATAISRNAANENRNVLSTVRTADASTMRKAAAGMQVAAASAIFDDAPAVCSDDDALPVSIFSFIICFTVSGVAELGLGLAVLSPGLRRFAAWGIILLLIAILPANIHIALHNVPVFGATQGAGVWNWVRLPLQGVLILWAWWYT